MPRRDRGWGEWPLLLFHVYEVAVWFFHVPGRRCWLMEKVKATLSWLKLSAVWILGVALLLPWAGSDIALGRSSDEALVTEF